MKKVINITKKLSFLLILAFIAVGCGNDKASNLKPAKPTPKTNKPGKVVINQIKGIKATVQADAWPGDPGITTEVTPLQVKFVNNSNMPVALGYNHFAIVTPDGEYHAALPPFQINGQVDELELSQSYGGVQAQFAHRGFAVAPVYGSIYSGIGTFGGYGFYGYGYYGTYWGYWGDMDNYNKPMPTKKMLNHALPEGVLKPGGIVKGFLYFQKVNPDDVDEVRFTAELINANNKNTFGEISIPFKVSKVELKRAHN